MADQPISDRQKIEAQSEAQKREHDNLEVFKMWQEEQRERDRQHAAHAETIRSNIPPIVLREAWWSPRTILDIFLIVFTGGVMWATLQYSDTAKKAERPWVGIENIGQYIASGIGTTFTLTPDAPANVGILYRNYGQSPAKGADYFRVVLGDPAPETASAWADNAAPQVPDCHQKVDAEVGSPIYQGSGLGAPGYRDHQIPSEIPAFSAPDVDQVKNGKKSLYVVGCIGYTDQWNKRHYTDFCVFLDNAAGTLSGEFSFCGKGNEGN